MSWLIVRRNGVIQACGLNDGNFVPYIDEPAGDVLTEEATPEWPVPDIPVAGGPQVHIPLVALAVPQAI